MRPMPVALRPTALVLAAGLAVAAAITLTAQSVARPPAEAALAAKGAEHLPIRRLTLHRSGVGSFERRGMIDGNAKVQLRFKTDQINDILKSMVVLDLSKGKGEIDGISYASKEPLARRLASFGIDISDNPSMSEVLNRLRGTPVRIALIDGSVSGTVMNVENRATIYSGSEKTATKHDLPWVNLLTDTGIRSVNLTNATGFEILDPTLAGELGKALAALAEHRADRTKTVDVNLRGEGARDIVIAYVQEAPVWKTSYRLVLPDLPKQAANPDDLKIGGQPTIQGWAIVENTTDEDWTDVKLGLVAGRPVSFRMDLYEPLYVFRPEIPVPTVPGVLPRQYAGGDAGKKDADKEAGARQSAGAPAAAPMVGTAMKSAMRERRAGAAGGVAGDADAAENLAYARVSAEDMAGYSARAQAQGVEAGELFQFELENPVTVERQRSAMLPILAAPIEGRRVSIFNANDSSENPMRGVELKNNTKLQLMPGPISVFDAGTYAGDAQIGHVPEGDRRLLAYAVDLDITARRDQNTTDDVRKFRIVHGAFEITYLRRQIVAYTFTSKDQARARILIVEQPKIEGWTLDTPKDPYETTKDLYRFEVPLAAAQQAKLSIEQSQTTAQTVGVVDFDATTLLNYSKQGKVSKAVMDAYQEAARRQALVADTQRQINDLEAERNQISQDQTRIRQNMGGLDRTTDLYNRYVRTLNEQETRLEAVNKNVAALHAQLKKQQDDLASYIANLNVE